MLVQAIRTVSRPSRFGVMVARRGMKSAATGSSTTGGSIADVFATLSGGSLEDALPDRFSQLKRQIASQPGFQSHVEASWSSLLPRLSRELDVVGQQQQRIFPSLDARQLKEQGHKLSAEEAATIKQRGAVVVRGVVPEGQALQWKEDIRSYARKNDATGFPAEDPQVYELYWSKPQVAARAHAEVLNVSRALLQLWHRPAGGNGGDLGIEQLADMSTPLTYADRLRIRHPGDAKFALGPHFDGGGVERWEDPDFRAIWDDILSPQGQGWQRFDNYSLGPAGQRLTAKTALYNGPGQCSVFRPWQGWLSLSHTGPGEGTLRVLPNLKETTAYIILRPFFEHIRPRTACSTLAEYLSPSNWCFDGTSSRFPGCSLGHNIELSSATHPHLRLDESSMVSLCDVKPGDMVLWSCDAVHSVESRHAGKGDSSVMYIPAIPLTANNWRYVRGQARAFEEGRAPSDFPQGEGEGSFAGRTMVQDVQVTEARQAMGLQGFGDASGEADEGTRKLRTWCTAGGHE